MKSIANQPTALPRILTAQNEGLKDLFRQIRPLLLPPPAPSRRPIGFHVKEGS